MKAEQIAGLMIIATKSEADRVTISVFGRKLINWPMTSGQARSGQKATSVATAA